MKLSLLCLVVAGTTTAFVPQYNNNKNNNNVQTRVSTTTILSAASNNNDNWMDNIFKTIATTALVTGALWGGPSVNTPDNFLYSQTVANAKELASGSGSRVNKDAESLLRYGLPIKNKDVRKLQVEIEDIKLDIGAKRKGAVLDHVKTIKKLITDKNVNDKLKASCREPAMCAGFLAEMGDTLLDPITTEITKSQNEINGSEQERKALDAAYGYQDKLSKLLTSLEEQMVPAGYKPTIPKDYAMLPRLETGRATIEMVFEKAQGAKFVVDGVSYKEAKLTMVVDGYTAPITSGNFIDLVDKGFYTKMPVQRSDGFVVQTGEPTDGSSVGYVPPTGTQVWEKGSKGERNIPLEIFVVGDKAPTYELTIEDDGRGGQATVLPFSSYGAMGWARNDYEANSGSSQFFWLLFDSDLTPAGKNLLDGNFPCFGYVTEGADFLKEIKEGDVITSAKVVDGMENFVRGADAKVQVAQTTQAAAAESESS